MGSIFFYQDSEHPLGDIAVGRWREMRRLLPALVDCLNESMAQPDEILQLAPLHEFRAGGGVLAPGQLLSVMPPFVFRESADGVSYRAIPALDRLKFLAHLAKEIRDVPDGAKLTIKVENAGTLNQTPVHASSTVVMDPTDQQEDIPYGEDWQSVAEVTAWAEASDRKRPWRSQFRDFIAEQVATLRRGARVLELGSGPGFLAERVLQHCTQLAGYTLLDFSGPLLAMSRERLTRFAAASFVLADFKLDRWVHAVGGQFDCVVSMQAIHEVRHKRHVPRLYRQIYQVTATSGLVLICDHTPLDDSHRSISLYMTEQEQMGALSAAGFANVRIALSISGLVLYAGKKTG